MKRTTNAGMMIDYAQIFNSYVSFTRKCMVIIGMWPKSRPTVAYRFLGIFAATANFLTALGLLRFAIIHVSNLNILVKGIGAAGSIGLSSLKGFLMVYYKKDLLQILNTLRDYHLESAKSRSLKWHMLDHVTSFYCIQRIQTFVCGTGIGIYIIGPVIALMQHSFTNTSTIAQTLPMPTAFPWRIQPTDGLYIATYAYVSYSLIVSLCTVYGVDAFFSVIIIYVVTQLRVMSSKITNIQKASDYNDTFKSCVDQYTILRSCCGTLQSVFGPVILWMMIINSIVICSIVFQLSQDKHMSSVSLTKYILIFSHVATKIIQTFGYAYAGSTLTAESKGFLNAVYSSNWQKLERQQTRVSILITLTQRPLRIVIMKFIVVSMDTFVATMNSTVSYFFLLKTLEQKNL